MRVARLEAGLPRTAVLLLVAVAILGYVAGHSSSSHSGAAPPSRSAASGNLVVNYPSGWRAVTSPPAISGLVESNAVGLSPERDGARAGLILGTLRSPEASPLPRAFVSALPRLPATEVVNLLNVQAYRYSRLQAPGSNQALVVFAIPNPGGAASLLTCYGPSEGSSELHACEQIVASVTVGQTRSSEILPEVNYSRQVSAAVSALDRERVAVRHALGANLSTASVRQLSTRLADGFAAAAASLSGLEAPPATQEAQRLLVSSLQQAQTAYAGLATAAAEESVSAYAQARKRASEAEANVDWALESYALLGYTPER